MKKSKPKQKQKTFFYTVRNLHFQVYGYDCIIAKKLYYDQIEMFDEDVVVYKVELEGSTMWMFTKNWDYELN